MIDKLLLLDVGKVVAIEVRLVWGEVGEDTLGNTLRVCRAVLSRHCVKTPDHDCRLEHWAMSPSTFTP